MPVPLPSCHAFTLSTDCQQQTGTDEGLRTMNRIAHALMIFSAVFTTGALLQMSGMGSSNGKHGDSGAADDPNTKINPTRSGQKRPSVDLDSSQPARPKEQLRQSQGEGQPTCTVDQLLPSLEEDLEDRWVPLGVNEIRPQEYDCTCPYTKTRYGMSVFRVSS